MLPGQTEAIYECRKILAQMGSQRTVLLSTLSYKSAHIAVKNKYSMMASSMHTYQRRFSAIGERTDWVEKQRLPVDSRLPFGDERTGVL